MMFLVVLGFLDYSLYYDHRSYYVVRRTLSFLWVAAGCSCRCNEG